MTLNQIGDVLLIEIMGEADLNEIAPLTKAFLLQQTLDANSNVAIRRYAVASAAARNEQTDEDEDADFVARHDAVLAGLANYLDAVTGR